MINNQRNTNSTIHGFEIQQSKDCSGAAAARPDLEQTAFLLCRGGWPYACRLEGRIALRRAFAYVDAVAKRDISRVDGVARDEDRTRRLLRSYARLQGTAAAATAVKADLEANEDFVDPSVASAALGLGPADLMNDLKTYGLLFETMAVRDLRVYMDALDGSVAHYLDASGLECDAVLHRRNGDYGLVEIKLGGGALVEKGAASLKNCATASTWPGRRNRPS